MEGTLKHLFIAFAVFQAASLCFGAEERPVWVSKYPTPDSNYYYAVGIGEAENLATAMAEAEKRAWISLVQDVIGITGVARTSVDSTMHGVQLNDEIQFTSDVVELKGLETIGTYSEQTANGTIRAYVLRRYPKSEASALKKMISGSGGKLLNRVMIDSLPHSAEVSIDGEPYGITPMQVMLPSRAYKLTLRKSGYQPFSQRLILNSGTDQQLQIKLEAQSGTFVLTVSPQSATVTLDDQSYGQEEVHQFNLSAGKHRLSVECQGYKTLRRSILIRANRTLTMNLSLQEMSSSPPPRTVATNAIPTSWNERCTKLVKKNKWPELVQIGSDWAERESYQPNAYFYQGLGLMMLNRLDRAIENLQRANAMRTDPVILQTLCDAYSRNYQYGVAYKYCNQSLDLNLKDPYTYVLLAWIYKSQNQLDRAYENFKVAISLNHAWKHELVRFCRSSGVYYLYGNCSRYWW